MSAGHLEIPAEQSCSFCEYLRGDRAYTILVEEPLTAVLVTQEQRGIGHCLVVTRAHRKTVLDLSDRECSEVFLQVRRVAKALDSAFKGPGIAVWQNNGLPAGQAIPHFHVHVAGTLANGGTERGEVPELSVDETEVIASRLRPHLDPI